MSRARGGNQGLGNRRRRVVVLAILGWQENGHQAYGMPFYTMGDRLQRLDEGCQALNIEKVAPAFRKQR